MAKRINSKTSECDTVWDGSTKTDVLRRIGEFLVLRSVSSGDIFLRNINGGSRRFLTIDEAVQEAVNRTVQAQVEAWRALMTAAA